MEQDIKVAILLKALAFAPRVWREAMIEDLNNSLAQGFELCTMRSYALREYNYPVTPFMEYDRDVYFFAKVEGKDFLDNDLLVTDFGEMVARSWGGRIVEAEFKAPLW